MNKIIQTLKTAGAAIGMVLLAPIAIALVIVIGILLYLFFFAVAYAIIGLMLFGVVALVIHDVFFRK